MGTTLPNLVQTCSRTDVSDRSVAFLIKAALDDIIIITKENSSKVINRSKIRRESLKKQKDMKRTNRDKIFHRNRKIFKM